MDEDCAGSLPFVSDGLRTIIGGGGVVPTLLAAFLKINDGDCRKHFELAKKNGACLSDHMSCIMNFQAI